MDATTYERSGKLVSDAQAWHELSCARRRFLMAFGAIAPLTALGGPLLAAPAWGDWGWGATGVGLLACVALLFLLARIDADLSGLQPVPALARRRVRAPAQARAAAGVQSLSGARAARRAMQAQASHAFQGARRRPYRLAH